MPNRIIKESVCTSDTINHLSLFEEVFFYRLIVTCDDYGRCDARPAILKGKMFPLRDVRNDQISEALTKLALEELATLYEVDGKPFVQLSGWAKHQRIRNTVKKYPDPPQSAASRGELPQVAARIQNPESRIQNPESESIRVRGGGLLTESEQDTLGQAYRDGMAAIEDQSNRMGMEWHETDRATAERLMAEYTLDWVIEAMRRAATGPVTARSWRYIEGILKKWKAGGGIDGPGARRTNGSQLRGDDPAEPPGGVPGGLTHIERY